MAKSKMMICRHCGAEIAKSAKVCPQCGGKNKKPVYKRPWFIILIVIVVLVIIAGSSGSRDTGTKKVGEVSTAASSESAVSAGSSEKEAKSEDSGKMKEAETAQTEAPQTVFHVGDILQDGDMKIVYIASGDYQEDNEFSQPKEGNKYIFLKFAFINESKSDASVSFYSFDAYADGYACEMHYGGDEDLSATLSAGRSTSGCVYYEVPADAKEIEVEYTTNFFTSEKITFVFEGDQDSGYTLEPNTQRSEGALAVGDAVEGDRVRITYLSCEPYVSDNMFIQPAEGCHYVTVELEFENTGSSDQSISSLSFDCYADGIACNQVYIRDDDLSGTISAGRKIKGTVTFEVPDAAQVVEAEYNDNVWTSHRIVFTVQ